MNQKKIILQSLHLNYSKIFLRKFALYQPQPKPQMDDCTIQMYNPITDFEDVQKIFRKSYLPQAKTSLAFNLNANTAQVEYEKYILDILNDGLTLVARHVPTNRIIGYMANKMQSHPAHGEPMFYEKCLEKYKEPNFRNYLSIRAALEKEINLFQKYDCEHFIQIMNFVICEEFRNNKMSYRFIEKLLQIAINMRQGIYLEKLTKQHMGKNPSYIFTIATSEYSVRVAEKYGFKVLQKIPLTGTDPMKELPSNSQTTLLTLKL